VCPQLHALSMKIPTLAYLFFSGLVVSCLSANVYVDDADLTWAFSGHGDSEWVTITPSNRCPGCALQPDPSRAFDGPWHDTSNNNASAQLVFTGVSIQIYTTCPPVIGPWAFFTNVSFKLDEIGDGFFVELPSCSQYVYNYAVWISPTAFMWSISQPIWSQVCPIQPFCLTMRYTTMGLPTRL
jgi:hypothetical protein